MALKPELHPCPATDGVNDDDEVKINQFVTWHIARVNKGRRDIPVKELREIIPILYRHCYDLKYDPSTKKVKGMWEKRPSGWDTAVPFLDPNNKGDQGKPKKEVLMQMFNYLLEVYQKTGIGTKQGPIQESDTLDRSEVIREVQPVEATDAGSYDWNPLEDSKQRIGLKLNSMQSQTFLSLGEIGVLNVAKDVLFRLFDQLGKKESLTYAHDFELTLDIVKATKVLPQELSQKCQEFEDEGNKLNVASYLHTPEKLDYKLDFTLGDSSFLRMGREESNEDVLDVSSRLDLTDYFTKEIDWSENLGTLEMPHDDNLIQDGEKSCEDVQTARLDHCKVDDINQGDVSNDDINQGDVSNDEINQGDVSNDDINQGDVSNDDINQGDVSNDDINQGDVSNDDINQGDVSNDDINQGDVSNYDINQGDVSNDDINQGDVSNDDINQGDVSNDDINQGDVSNDINQCDVSNDDISIHQQERHNSGETTDNDHSHVRMNEMATTSSPTGKVCSQVERMRISSSSRDTEQLERGTKRGYSEPGIDSGRKRRRMEDMDIVGAGGGSSVLGGEKPLLDPLTFQVTASGWMYAPDSLTPPQPECSLTYCTDALTDSTLPSHECVQLSAIQM